MSTPTASPAASALIAEFAANMREVTRTAFHRGEERHAPAWMYWLWTGIFSTGIGCGLTLIFITFNRQATLFSTFFETLLISLCIGYSVHICFEALFRLVSESQMNAWPAALRFSALVGMPLIGTVMGYTISFGLQGRNFVGMLIAYPRLAVGLFLIGTVASLIWYVIVSSNAKRYRLEAERAHEVARAETAERQASVARLSALQAQIEPHFLFNTLANVQALIDYDAPKAKHMLESFIEYLRATLDASRRTEATLGDELALVERYLQLIAVRMGERLHFSIEAAPELRSLPFAPLMLQPLVENAIKYGLEPKIAGGTLRITAQRDGTSICINVSDDGIGLNGASTAKKGSGVGLVNVRERLKAVYQERALLTITSNASAGVTSSITIQT